jgi:hypothetical protein
MLDPGAAAMDRLTADGLVRHVDGQHRTTRRWQGAMARAALELQRAGARDDDLRVPVAYALVGIYGDDRPDEELASLVEAMLPIEAAELAPGAVEPRVG